MEPEVNRDAPGGRTSPQSRSIPTLHKHELRINETTNEPKSTQKRNQHSFSIHDDDNISSNTNNVILCCNGQSKDSAHMCGVAVRRHKILMVCLM